MWMVRAWRNLVAARCSHPLLNVRKKNQFRVRLTAHACCLTS
jgi:hypothetical protein